MSLPLLLPTPRSTTTHPGTYELSPGRLILLDSDQPGELLPTAQRLRDAVREHSGVTVELTASDAVLAEMVAVALRVRPGTFDDEQRYRLTIEPDRIVVEAAAPVGVYYGVCTLVQLVRLSGSSLPCLAIDDWPDFAARGVMLDVSRDKVPTMATLYHVIDLLAGWKVNQLQLYTEHTFAYRNHPDVWATASPVTGEDILELDAYCRERFIELVPNQNSFGHLHRWLEHEAYASLAEIHGEFTLPWGTRSGPFSLSPVDPGSLQLVAGLYDELLPHFSSRQLNVGCDETFDLGQGRSKQACEERGTGRVYLDFVLDIHREVTARGRTMQFWGDIVERYPELIPELPMDAVALAWGYEAGHLFAETGGKYAEAGIPFYVCPGTSAWCSVAGRTTNALGNLRNAAENGLRHGAIGYLITDWGDRGHWEVLPVSYLGYVAGAAYSWAFDANRDLDVATATSLYAFADPTGTLGRIAYDLGDVYTTMGLELPNSTVPFWILQSSLDLDAGTHPRVPTVAKLGAEAFRTGVAAVDAAMSRIGHARSQAPDAALVRDEFELTARLLRHACRRRLFALGAGPDKGELGADLTELVEEYQRIWLLRNRPGGLGDSVGRLERLHQDYA